MTFSDNFDANTTVTEDKTVTVSMTTEENNYFTIADKDDWQVYCDKVQSAEYYDAKMTGDVDLGKDILMIGTTYSLYIKTFDGQGHTLTIDWTVNQLDQGQPFSYLGDGATIKNLRIKGQITSKNPSLSGLVVYAHDGTTISNCVSDVDITGNSDNWECEAAGLVQSSHSYQDQSQVTIIDCVVKGSINATTDKGKKGIAGFVYSQFGNCTLTNCLYVGENNASDDEKSNTFAPNATLENCYYLSPCGKVQGEQISTEQLKNGEVAKLLQGDRTDACHWAQQLGENPIPYIDADKSKANYVYYNKENKQWACDDFRLTDGQPLPIGIDFLAIKATHERPYSSIHSATICLPYEQPVNGFNAYTIKGGENNKVFFESVTGTLATYTPYYIRADGTPTLGGTNLQVKAYNGANLISPAQGYALTGTVDGIDNTTAAGANAYTLQDDGVFHKVTTEYPDATVPAYRAYVTCPPKSGGAKELIVILDGVPTDINGVKDEATDMNTAVYDLQGRRVADRLDATARQLPAGIYIVGGRKVILK